MVLSHTVVVLSFTLYLPILLSCAKSDADIKDNEVNVETGDGVAPVRKKYIPYALSPAHLITLSHKEEELYYTLLNYEYKLLETLGTIQRYKADYEDTSGKIINQIHPDTDPWDKHSHIAAGPILNHRMIRRFKDEINELIHQISQGLETKLQQDIENLKGLHVDWPREADYKDSLNALIRITDSHALNVLQFSEGQIKSELNYATNVGLTAFQCLEVAEKALADSNTVIASDWIQAAYAKVVSGNDLSVDTATITQLWTRAVGIHVDIWEIEKDKVPDTLFDDAKTEMDMYYQANKWDRSTENDESLPYNYLALCRGEELQTEKEKSKLFCYLETKKHPYWKINPQKIELRSTSPFLIQIHDFVNSRTMDALTEAFIPVMSFPQKSIVASNNLGLESEMRTSVTGWLDREIELSTPEIFHLSKKIEFITGLNVLNPESSDDYQLANYAYGSHYVAHLDILSSGNFTTPYGDRMATFIIYLDEAYSGSETVFAKIGTSIKPTKGSALFWYNHHKNGTGDLRTYHGGCPLREGFKMILTKWIYDQENFLKRPCATNQFK